jgi:hypothetical protein
VGAFLNRACSCELAWGDCTSNTPNYHLTNLKLSIPFATTEDPHQAAIDAMARTKSSSTQAVSQWGDAWQIEAPQSRFASYKPLPEPGEMLRHYLSVQDQIEYEHASRKRIPYDSSKRLPRHHPFQNKAHKNDFLQAMHAALPREVRDLIYAEILEDEDLEGTRYCLRLPQILVEKNTTQPVLMSSWRPFAQIGLLGGALRTELAEMFYERGRFCIVEPHIGHLDAFLHSDVLLGTDVIPSRHIRNLILDLGPFDNPDAEGNLWSSMLLRDRRTPRFENMRGFPDRIRSLLTSLSSPPEICNITIWYALCIKQPTSPYANYIEPRASLDGTRDLFMGFVAGAMRAQGLAKWRNVLVLEVLTWDSQSHCKRERETCVGDESGAWNGWNGRRGRYGDEELGWLEEARGAMGL